MCNTALKLYKFANTIWFINAPLFFTTCQKIADEICANFRTKFSIEVLGWRTINNQNILLMLSMIRRIITPKLVVINRSHTLSPTEAIRWVQPKPKAEVNNDKLRFDNSLYNVKTELKSCFSFYSKEWTLKICPLAFKCFAFPFPWDVDVFAIGVTSQRGIDYFRRPR